MRDEYRVHVSLTNEDNGQIFSEFDEDLDLFDDEDLDMGDIYRTAQSEYGRCTSSVYVNTPTGPKRVGWFFISRQKYTDTGEPYLRGAWVTVHQVVRPAAPETRTYVGLS